MLKGRPKPMVEVAGRPFLEWWIEELRQQGVRRLICCTGYRSDVIEDYFQDGSRWDVEIVYSKEPRPLGTAGALRHALDWIRTPRVFVLNGDSFCRVHLKRLEEVHQACGSQATIWLVGLGDSDRYGYVRLGDDSRIQAFHEKPLRREPGLISAGVYLLERSLVERIPDGQVVSLEFDIFPALIGRGLHGVVGEQPFIDIGTPDACAQASDVFAKEFLR